MKKETAYFSHISALTSLFILGNAVIILPFGKVNEFTFLAFIFSAFLSFLAFIPTAFCAKMVFKKENTKNIGFKTIQIILAFALAVFSLFCGADAFYSFLNFAKKIILPSTAVFFIAVILFICVLFFALKPYRNLLKFFLISAVFVGFVIIFFFIATSFDFNLRNVFIFRIPETKSLLTQAKPYIIKSVLPTLILPFYNVLTFKNLKKGATLSGFLIGYILLGICVIGPVLLFGANFAGDLEFPYFSGIGTVSFGRLFTRLDGFSYFLFFITTLAKTTVSLIMVFKSLETISYLLNKKKSQLR